MSVEYLYLTLIFQVSVTAAEFMSALFSIRPIGNLTDSHNQLISDTHFCEKPPGCVTLGRVFFTGRIASVSPKANFRNVVALTGLLLAFDYRTAQSVSRTQHISF